ncbi:MAG: hypothetical protein AAGB31_04135 [Bdellovibrio sp.]
MKPMTRYALFFSILIPVVFSYQNCSKIHVEDLASELPVDSLNAESDYSKVSVGTGELADLRMLFVVDNSYTMKSNNINLSDSFETMFNPQNSDSLEKFAVNSYVLTVGQRTPAATLQDQTRISTLLNWQVFPSSSLTSSQLQSARSSSNLGKLAGDALGYSVKKESGSYFFEPAPVLALSNGSISKAIIKGKDESASNMILDFQNRMGVLQDINLSNYEANKDILDEESGLCAVARALRSPAFFKSGDLAAINIFTDENDADESGKNCLASYTYSEGNEDLHDGRCETRKTTFGYKVSAAQADQCVYSYKNDFSWKITYNEIQPVSSISFYKISGYSCPQTQVKYKKVSAWLKKQTQISISYKKIQVLDGVQVLSSANYSKSLTVDGYKSSAECVTLAKAQLNSSSESYVSNTCQQAQNSVASCSFSDSNCVQSTVADVAQNIAGDYTDSSSCLSKAQSLDSNFIAGSQACSLTGSQVTASSSAPSCSAVVALSTVSNLSKDLSTAAACQAEATSRGAYITSQYQPSCSTANSGVVKTKSSSSNLSDHSYVNGTGNCPATLKTKIAQYVGISESSLISCAVESIPERTASESLAKASCNVQAAEFCSSHSGYQNCALKEVQAGGSSSQSKSLIAQESLSCSSLCSESKTGFCQPTGSLSSVDPSLSISAYIAQAYQGSNCSASVVRSSTVSQFQAKTANEVASLCPAKTSSQLPIYTNVENTYRFTGFAPDYIAGNAYNGSSIEPKVDLPTYILQRSQELFGSQKPIVNIFVRTANDPLGDSGSRGLAYERMATMMNGQVHSVLSSDYSPALQDLSSIIKSKMLRTFKVPNMKETQKVVAVRRISNGSQSKLSSSQWSQSGLSVQIAEGVALNLGDELEFEFQ